MLFKKNNYYKSIHYFNKWQGAIAITAFLLFNFLLVNPTQASIFEVISKGFGKTGQEAGYKTKGVVPATEFIPAWLTYMNGFLLIMGLFFVIRTIYAGYIWLAARGREDQIEKAKSVLIQNVIGILILISARIIAEITITQLGKTVPS